MALVPAAAAEDWRDLLRDAFGLTEDYTVEAEATQAPAEEKYDGPVTDPQQIVNYLDEYGELPDNFITKKEARALGWDSSYNYVGDVAPGMSIGGDRFGNYEGQLPSKKGRTWYECDTNYKGKKRGATRLLYSSDGLYYYTDDHYNTFTEMYPED
ncbi:MAG: ribonuclease [Clostridia bacterium]|nr:ribonuclease [Clostridia bacterium]